MLTTGPGSTEEKEFPNHSWKNWKETGRTNIFGSDDEAS
jgi:hypothetical protein